MVSSESQQRQADNGKDLASHGKDSKHCDGANDGWLKGKERKRQQKHNIKGILYLKGKFYNILDKMMKVLLRHSKQ